LEAGRGKGRGALTVCADPKGGGYWGGGGRKKIDSAKKRNGKTESSLFSARRKKRKRYWHLTFSSEGEGGRRGGRFWERGKGVTTPSLVLGRTKGIIFASAPLKGRGREKKTVARKKGGPTWASSSLIRVWVEERRGSATLTYLPREGGKRKGKKWNIRKKEKKQNLLRFPLS